jgi:1-acyl-sn-glycerol-3-phosphate acyltransferase
VGTVPRQGILVGAPHTSYWDFVLMLLVMWNGGVPPRVLMKQELFRGPVGWFLRRCGGIAVDRDKRFWRSGFYRIAQSAGLPIALAFVDGPTKTVGFGPTVQPSGDLAADMEVIRAFYADKQGIHPARRTEPRLREETSTGRDGG